MKNADLCRNLDVAIIGGGIIGCSTAYYLSKSGIKVGVFEKSHRVAEEQSGRNWGFVRQSGRDPIELPMMIRSNKIWQTLEKELNRDLGWQQGGILGVTNEEDSMSAYEDWCQMASTYDIETKLLNGTQVLDLLPNMQKKWAGGIFVPSDGNADPDVTTQAFADATLSNNGNIYTNQSVIGIDTKSGEICGILTDKGYIAARIVIIAAGAWSSKISSWLGISLPQIRVRGTVGRTEVLDKFTNIAAWTPSLGFVQRKDGCVTISGLDISDFDVTLDVIKFIRYYMPIFLKNRDMVRLKFGEPFFRDLIGRLPGSLAMQDPLRRQRIGEPVPNKTHLYKALKEFQELFDDAKSVKIKKAWAGYIEITPDMLPVLDDREGPSGLIIATGFSGHGFGIGPGAGSLIAEIASGVEPALDLNRFRLSRFKENDWYEPYNLI